MQSVSTAESCDANVAAPPAADGARVVAVPGPAAPAFDAPLVAAEAPIVLDIDEIVDEDVVTDDGDSSDDSDMAAAAPPVYAWMENATATHEQVATDFADRMGVSREYARRTIRAMNASIADMIRQHGAVRLDGIGRLSVQNSRPNRGPRIIADANGNNQRSRSTRGYATFAFTAQPALQRRLADRVRVNGRWLM